MVSLERMNRIIEILMKRKIISTIELEALMYCSTSTLRRDLIELEKSGKISRGHGEVRLVTSNNVEYIYSARVREEEKGKQHIADIASTFITDNQSIFIDSSSTSSMIVPYLGNVKNLCIITNGIEIARKLNNFDNITLFLSGGHINYGTNSALGNFASDFIDNFHANLAFISCRGLDKYGTYEANHQQALIKQHMIKNADKSVLLADHSKFNTSHYFKLAHYRDLDCVITDISPIESFQTIVESECEILW